MISNISRLKHDNRITELLNNKITKLRKYISYIKL